MPPQAQPNVPTELEAALEYVRTGMPVFPCNPLDKRPLTPSGFKDASKDEAQIHAWWGRWPNAIIAAPTGAASGMWVLDLDLDPIKQLNGPVTFDQIITQRGVTFPNTLMATTPRGGRHLVFVWDDNVEIRNSTGKIGPGIDVRGNGGYVCLPPSRNANGGEYRWDPNSAAQAVPAPLWLVTLAKAKKVSAYDKAALERECKAVAAARPGTRNGALNTAAFSLGQLIGGGSTLDEQEVRDRLFEAAETCQLVADDGAPAALATIDSGITAGKKQPRARPQPASQTGTRPTIRLADGELLRILTQIEDALLVSGLPVFSRAGRLVEPVTENMPASDGRKTPVARLRELSPESFLAPIAEAAVFQKWDRKRKTLIDTDPPLHYVRVLLASERRWRLPHVSGIITTPTLRPDGSLFADPGYDPETELYLSPGFQIPPIPEHPTKDQARAALKLLIDLVSEFSFKRVGGEHEKRLNRSVALSGLLTPLVRGSLPTAPVHLIAAHMAGTGKSYLVDTAAIIATGRLCPVITALKNVEETEKRLGAIILSGIPMVSLDNCTHDLGGDILCQIAERPVIKVRILGYSETPDCEVHTAVFATGNNITFKGDMVRRGLVCNLETLDERPELRRFNRNTLRQAGANRATYVAAGLTIMRAYLAAGAPEVCGPFASYAEWSAMVRSPLVWLGEPDPVASIETTQAEDSELADIRGLFNLCVDEYRPDATYGTVTFLEAASAAPIGFNPNPFRELLLRIAGGKDGDISAKRLGEWLRRNCGRVVRIDDGRRFRLVRQPHLRDGRAQFRLEEVI
jgi:Bifunctional DNA primase/polymerase, N-terminal